MSKDSNNLRLLGSPVSLSYRNKKKEEKKNNIRIRPRSALQTSYITPDNQERLKRPFSADAKEHAPTTRTLLKAFSAELLQSYRCPTSIKISAPTFNMLGDTHMSENENVYKDKELCSNASDYGSEDTFMSLGTKIKARAQLSPKPKSSNSKNLLRYRNIARKARKNLEASICEGGLKQPYGMEIKITDRPKSPIKNKNMFHERSLSPPKTRPYESYFIPVERNQHEDYNKIHFDSNIHADKEEPIDCYSKHLTLNKQQLSLVEEESTQDVDSVPSQNLSSLSPTNSLDENETPDEIKYNVTGKNTFRVTNDTTGCKSRTEHYQSPKKIQDPNTYASFYDQFQSDTFKKLSSTYLVHTDSSSKDSGYQENGIIDEKFYKQNYSLPTTSSLKNSQLSEQPKSLDRISTNSNDKNYTSDINRQWTEPMNHSRLLYKDFFLKKEGHITLPPQNSPNKVEVTIPGIKCGGDIAVQESEGSNYPPYLINSTTKAYTSKVIEDYKKELEAINNLHELTIKDIKIDTISPTPLNIDKMFENHDNISDDIQNDKKETSYDSINELEKNSNALDKNKRDVMKISTKELISNYFKVKEGDVKDHLSKNVKRKTNNVNKEEITLGFKQEWNNKTRFNYNKNIPVIRNQTQKNLFSAPVLLSARIESVQNDKDIDSWMSLSTVSPTVCEVQDEDTIKEIVENTPTDNSNEEKEHSQQTVSTKKESDADNKKNKELTSNSSVLDIYSMLKEIESYGDNPVTSVAKVEEVSGEEKKEERSTSPKDNFMEIFEFLEKVEQSANEALSVVTNTTPSTTPKLEVLLKLPHTELAQRLVTASLQLEERSCCIALLQESLAHHKEQMINKVSNLEKQSLRNIGKVKQECEETIKRHQNFIDQLINDKKTLNHRIEQLVDERRNVEERWKRTAQAVEDRHKLELRNQHDKMTAAQQVARQRWVRQKAEKIKELTVKGLEGELREMADRQQKEISDLKMMHAENTGRKQARHAQELEELRRTMEEEKQEALLKERQLASSRLEKQILELELTYQEQRTKLVAEMRAENDRVAAELAHKEKAQWEELDKWKREQESLLEDKKQQLEREISGEKEKLQEQIKLKQEELEEQFEQYKREYEAEQQSILKKKVTEIAAQHKQERDREIERAIDSMDAEAQAGRRELQDAIRRNKEQYEAELKELAETEQATLRRYQEAQARVRQTEDKCAELEVTMSQLETRNRLLTEKNNQLETKADEIKANCEDSWRDKIENYKKEIEEMKKTHDEQMHQLYAKVKVAVARKDSAIQALTRETNKYQEKITMLEQKLQQQRKDFLKQK